MGKSLFALAFMLLSIFCSLGAAAAIRYVHARHIAAALAPYTASPAAKPTYKLELRRHTPPGAAAASPQARTLRDAFTRSQLRAEFLYQSRSTIASSDHSTASTEDPWSGPTSSPDAGHEPPALQTPVGIAAGEFITTLAIGTPPVSFSAAIDTGSDLVWRQCLPCSSCFPQSSSIFDPASSLSYTPASCFDTLCQSLATDDLASCNNTTSTDASVWPLVLPTCTYIYSYADSSTTSGDLARDTLVLPDATGNPQIIPDFAFGCGHNNQSPFNYSGTGGIVGLGKGPLSLNSQLGVSQFSYCLASIAQSTSGSGALFLGPPPTFPPSLQTDDAVSTPIITSFNSPTFYYVNLIGISVGGALLDIPVDTFASQADGSGGVIVDSGTTFTMLPEDAYKKLLEAMQAIISLPIATPAFVWSNFSDLCYLQSPAEIPINLTFHFEGGDLTFPMENYFINIDGLFCLAMAPSPGTFAILGNILQQNFLVQFDNASNLLSFVPTDCSLL